MCFVAETLMNIIFSNNISTKMQKIMSYQFKKIYAAWEWTFFVTGRVYMYMKEIYFIDFLRNDDVKM